MYSVGCRATIKKSTGRTFKVESLDKTKVDAWDVSTPGTSTWFQNNKGKKEAHELAEYVVFQNQSHINIPEGIAKAFPNMRTFAFNNAGVKRISKYDLRQFDKVERLDFDNNELEYLESEHFKFNPSLQHLSLQHNKINIISETSGIDSMKYLVLINLLGNKCFSRSKDCVDDSFVSECKEFAKEAINACPAPPGFDMGVIRENQWERGRRVLELTELKHAVKAYKGILADVAGIMKPNETN